MGNPFKGRLGFKLCLNDKPTKWGITVFVLADATSGFIKTFQIYTGRTVEKSGNSIGVCSKVVLALMSGLENSGNSIGVCSKVVLDLMSGLENSGFLLYTDNYYTSPPYTIIYIIMTLVPVGQHVLTEWVFPRN